MNKSVLKRYVAPNLLGWLVAAGACLILSAGCATSVRKPDAITYYFSLAKLKNEDERNNAAKVMREINSGRDARRSQDRLKDLYGDYGIRRLFDIRPDDYVRYRKYLDPASPTVYIVVHPGFYSFFMSEGLQASGGHVNAWPVSNVVERFYEKVSSFDPPLQIMQEQEMVLRDFIRTTAAEKKMMIVVVPGGEYRRFFRYGYVEGVDEYVRYINELTGGSESVVYIESIDWNDGLLTDSGAAVMSSFLKALQPQNILLGGGFVGRCVERLADSVRQGYGGENMYLIPEITAVSLEDIHGAFSLNLMTKEGKLNFQEIADNLRYAEAYNGQNTIDQKKSLYIYEFSNGELKLVSQPRPPKKPARRR